MPGSEARVRAPAALGRNGSCLSATPLKEVRSADMAAWGTGLWIRLWLTACGWRFCSAPGGANSRGRRSPGESQEESVVVGCRGVVQVAVGLVNGGAPSFQCGLEEVALAGQAADRRCARGRAD